METRDRKKPQKNPLNRVTDVEIEFMVTKGKTEEINWETGTDIYILLYTKQITNMDLLYSTGDFPGSSAGKESACNAGDPGSIPE